MRSEEPLLGQADHILGANRHDIRDLHVLAILTVIIVKRGQSALCLDLNPVDRHFVDIQPARCAKSAAADVEVNDIVAR